MAKNALQAQLLKAGLVDSKKAKKISKQTQHAKRTGDSESVEAKKALAEAQAQKLASKSDPAKLISSRTCLVPPVCTRASSLRPVKTLSSESETQ